MPQLMQTGNKLEVTTRKIKLVRKVNRYSGCSSIKVENDTTKTANY